MYVNMYNACGIVETDGKAQSKCVCLCVSMCMLGSFLPLLSGSQRVNKLQTSPLAREGEVLESERN